MKCLNLYNSLFLREAADSNQCQAAKDEHADACCFEKCKVCEFGSLDTTATVNVNGTATSCSALESSFSKDVVVEGSTICSAKRAEYAAACCYTSPDNPCKVCPAGSDVNGDVSVNFYGETKSCADIGNKLALSEEAGSETCSATQKDFSRECCFERCPLCPDGFNLNWEVDIEYNRATIACGELDGIISGNAIHKSSQECYSLRSTFTSACCYNYATATFAEYSDETTLVQVITTGFLSTDLDTSTLTPAQKEDAKIVFQNLIKNTLEAEADLPQDSAVTIIDIDENGVVHYEIAMKVDDSVVVSNIDATFQNTTTLEAISSDLQAESAGSSVAEELSKVNVINFVQGETSTVAAAGTAATGAGPCNLCNAGEIGLEKQILFNGAQTSCPQVYRFLATQEEAGSDACAAGKEALHKECCMKKCDLCSSGGIPDWYSMVNVNGKTMTCLELDGIVTESQIQSGSDQCSQLLEVAAPACCYVPPTEPCHLCKNGFGFDDVKSSITVDYGGTNATCGQIFNTLFSREEQDSEACSLLSHDLASKCCYDQCSLCGGLQTDAALSVTHDEAQLGCSEFDSYIFSSNLIEEGSNECNAFQNEHRESCCYDIACSLCAKGDDIYTIKESSMVQYGGSEVTCGEVANFLYEQEMSQSNVCLAAHENIFSDCCFQQCEICDAGSSINWAATTTFNKQSQSCTDVYWLLISESVEAGTEACSGLSQVSKDCCYKVPSQQCTLCKDDNGATYNTRWNTEVTVNGMTKTCGDFNTLLATQESESDTCSMAKEAIFNDCCFAGSDTLVAVANQLSTDSDAPCSLCKPVQISINAEVVFNNNPTTCEEVRDFLIDGFQESSTTCKSAQVKLSLDCCRDQDDLSSSSANTTGIDGEGSITAEGPSGEKIVPPLEFETWTRKPSGANSNARLGKLCTAIIFVFAVDLLLFG